jgi:hypothetical protein
MDLIPESIVIGAGFNDFSSYRYTFIAAVFLANFPEAMASSNAMMLAGFSKKKIFRLLLTALQTMTWIVLLAPKYWPKATIFPN